MPRTLILMRHAKSSWSSPAATDFDRPLNGTMDISKAVREIGFKPTPTKEAFKETVEWYEDQFRNNEAVRTEMITRFMTYAIPREKKPKLYGAIDRELEKAGVKVEKIRKKRKGDLEEFEKDEL